MFSKSFSSISKSGVGWVTDVVCGVWFFDFAFFVWSQMNIGLVSFDFSTNDEDLALVGFVTLKRTGVVSDDAILLLSLEVEVHVLLRSLVGMVIGLYDCRNKVGDGHKAVILEWARNLDHTNYSFVWGATGLLYF